MSKVRLNWVDYAKGIGIILVVYGHVLRGIFSADIALGESYYFISDNIVYSFHMPLFLFLSGIFAERWTNKLPTIQGITEKAKFLLLPYIIWSVIQGTFNIVLSRFTNSQVTVSSLIHDIFLAPYGQFWFVYFLFIMFVIYALLRKLINVFLITTAFLFLYFLNSFLTLPYHFDTLFSNTIYFLLGAFVFTVIDEKRIEKFLSKNTSLYFSAIGFVLACVLLLNFQSNILSFLSALLGITMVLSLSQFLSSRNIFNWLITLGKCSMPIYLMHILAASGTRVILNKFLNIDSLLLHILLGTLIGIVAPLVFYLLTKNISISSVLFGTKSNQKKDESTITSKSIKI